MSRVSLIEQLYAPKRKSALEFDYDALWAPPIRYLLNQQDINELYRIATSLKYNDNIEKKYELIDAVMRPRGFKRGNCGTNRVVYNFLEDQRFCMKIALDRVGIKDSPAEFKNQEFFKPFCCKIFEVDPTGVIACVERVNPISSVEEFLSIADDVFNMMITKIIGKYVVDDLGSDKFMNYGIRYNSNGVAFGPVVIDFPYAYELDGAKLHCAKPIVINGKEYPCNGEIDYDSGLNNLVCCKCGRVYTAKELAKDDSKVIKFYTEGAQCKMRARIVRETDGTIVKDSGRSSNVYMTKEEYEEGNRLFEVESLEPRPVVKTIKKKYTPIKQLRRQYYTELQTKAYENIQNNNQEPFNPVIESEMGPKTAKRAKLGSKPKTDIEQENYIANEAEQNITFAKRAESLDEKVVDEKINTESLDEEVIDEKINTEMDDDKESITENTNHESSDISEESIEESTSKFDEEMEKSIFPELNNTEYFSDKENYDNQSTDYSNYESEEYDNQKAYDYDEDQYAEYYEEDRKAAKRAAKRVQKIKGKKYTPDADMNEY